ncbi:immunity-related GTPase family M protein-like [Echinops telfairi]|uniref:Immunity-related GTPase family M protein-like n=1 Tax=Echinops telfairi TaxID=9371 RepID=A0AC55CKC2_ECHTE|nr:immunity-related GTPase family M protein-like [Echinops telfairi]
MAAYPLSPEDLSSVSSGLFETGATSIEKDVMDGNLPNVIAKAKKTWKNMNNNVTLNIAVTGASGNGLSTFINALRNVGHDEETSAPTGVVRTTFTRASYSASCFPNVVLWDLPGMGASAQSLENYMAEMHFSQYDFVIIVASEQFSMNHAVLAKTIQKLGKKFYIVWNKLDMDLSKNVLSKEKAVKMIREYILETLWMEQVNEPPIFLVSSFDLSLHGFRELKQTLKKDLLLIRYQDPLQNLLHTCEAIINDKQTFLQKKVDTLSFQDIHGIEDPDNSEACLKVYKVHFGVDDESILRVAQIMESDVLDYTANMKSQDLQTLSNVDWLIYCMNFNTTSYLSTIFSYIPVFGVPITNYIRWMKHRYFLEVVAKDTKTILRKILKDSIN